MTYQEAIIISCYTGYVCCEFSDMHEAVEKKLGFPVWTHEFADKEIMEKIRAAFKEDFLSILPKKEATTGRE